MKENFVLLIALRYFREKRKSKRTASASLAIAGIAIGIMTLTVTIGVMNGFQLSFIEPIVNIGSYHIQAYGRHELQDTMLDELRKIEAVTALVPFIETQAILDGKTSCLIRAIPKNVNELDPSFSDSFYKRGFTIPDERSLADDKSILLGSQLAAKLGKGTDASINVTTLNGKPFETMTISGLFQTWYYDIDSQWAFVSLDAAKSLYRTERDITFTYGIKIRDRFDDGIAISAVRKILGPEGFTVSSWREYDPGFFGALLMEKIMMMSLIGLIFVVVGFNIYHSQKRSVLEKKNEIGILKAIGASPGSIRNVFLVEGFLIGVFGSAVGIALGCLVGYNINEIFRFVEYAANSIVFPAIGTIIRPFFPDVRFPRVSIFSTDVFYIEEIHSQILFPEVFFMSFIAICSSTFATLFASRAITNIKPSEVLRYE